LLVNRPELSIKEVAVMVGLGGSGALRRFLRRRLDLMPTQIRDRSDP
jgi:transcriptional regulator GlxA family with amidase domain